MAVRNLAKALASVDKTIDLAQQQLAGLFELRCGLIAKLPCPTCNAKPGNRCRETKGARSGRIMDETHAARERLARES